MDNNWSNIFGGLIICLPFLVATLLAIKWPVGGGVLLIIEGVFAFYLIIQTAFETLNYILAIILLCILPILAGIMFISHWQINIQKKRVSSEESIDKIEE